MKGKLSDNKVGKTIGSGAKLGLGVELLSNAGILWQMVKSSGNWSIKIALLGAIIYLIVPIDIISDFIPILGWIDDVIVIAILGELIRRNINKYKSDNNL